DVRVPTPSRAFQVSRVYYVSMITSHLFIALLNPLQRALHSFPTRRSSDLGAEFNQYRFWKCCFRSEDYLDCVTGIRARQTYYYRSEEHTSELQSRFDLVCRLLLEKKKGI